jgi:hypothetical protein
MALFEITGAAMKYIEEAHNLTDLWTKILEVDKLLTLEAWEALDLSDLPTFGGEPIPVHAGVWSWDKERVLVSSWLSDEDDAAAFALVTREQFKQRAGRPALVADIERI